MGVTSYYSFGGEIIGEETGGVRRDYLTDALGSVTATVTGAGVVENTYRYKPYGEQLAKTGAGSDPKFLWKACNNYNYCTILGGNFIYNSKNSRIYLEENGIWTNKSSNLSFQYVNPFDKGLRKGNSDTTCNLKTGDLESHIDNRNCALCDKHHEDVHKNDKDNKACCENFAKGCLRQFSESFCRQVRKTWTDENRNSFECDAYKVNSLCCIAVTCASFGGPPDGCNKDSFAMFGFDCENVYSRAEECCKRKKKITKCPFDKNGNYVGGTGKPDLPFCDEMYLPPKPRPFPPRRK